MIRGFFTTVLSDTITREKRTKGAGTLTTLSCLILLGLSTPALATAVPGTNNLPNPAPANLNPGAFSPQEIVNNIGSNPSQAMNMLQNVAPELSNNQAFGIINNLSQTLQNGQIDPMAAVGLIDQLSQGAISGQIGEALSNIPGLGNLDVGQIASQLGSGQLGQALNGLMQGGPQGAAQAVSQALSAAGIAGGQNVQQQITNAIANGATEILSQFLPPELAALGGGFLSGLLGGGLNVNFGNILGGGGGTSDPDPGGAGCPCDSYIKTHHQNIQAHMTNKRKEHEIWLLSDFFTDNVLPAMMLMTNQLSTVAMQQVHIIGTFLDAKHQLETQRLFQQMTAQTHKDYQPSEGMCTIGTGIRSLASSQRASEMAQAAVAARTMQRQLLQAGGSSRGGGQVDKRSRLTTFIEKFCDQKDNANGLGELCKGSSAKAEQKNMDIDYTDAVENKLTLDLDFYKTNPASDPAAPSMDEENIFALASNLYAHDVLPYVDAENLRPQDGTDPAFDAERFLLRLRAVAAKRSVAQNSFAAITSMRAAGDPESQPYLYKMVQELGVPDADIEKMLGKHPSYFAQMELLTKKAFQNPVFYTDLYDKPANIDRKGAALQALGLMQDRDIYESLLRSEAVLSVLLEMMIAEEEIDLYARLDELD